MPTVEEIAAAISGCGTLDEAVTACQQHGWTAVVDDGPLWPRVTVTDEDDTNSETFADLLNGMLSPAGPILRRLVLLPGRWRGAGPGASHQRLACQAGLRPQA